MNKHTLAACLLWLAAANVGAQTDTTRNRTLQEVSIQQRKADGITRMSGAANGMEIGQDELFRAACCNLGESFVTNPSVDVNYSDAAVGARQIKLLGLSGQYVQLLLENMPTTQGAATPYALGYVPGAWMKSIAVSKGASSVKNGPQSITGQINVDYLKPEDEPGLLLNLYTDSHLKTEANAVGNLHLGHHLSSEVLAHYERGLMHMDENGDGWHDSPLVEQLHLQNRWKLAHGRYIMHAGIGYLDEQRDGGQMADYSSNPYRVLTGARRLEAYMKHAFLIDRQHNTNLALLANGDIYTLDGTFGPTRYGNRQQKINAQLILEHEFSSMHSLSTGIGVDADRIAESHSSLPLHPTDEYTPGIYAQYTFSPNYRYTLMAGLRADHSTFFDRTYTTPRLHMKWVATDWMTLRASLGKGYRTPHPLAEHHYLLATGRTLNLLEPTLEEAWNSGVSSTFYIPLANRTITLNAEYYYTDFISQTVVDYDSDPTKIIISPLNGQSFSHTVQVDASCDITDELNLLAAWRYNHVMCTYGGKLREKPLQSRYKGLLTVGWRPMLALWQIDLTLQLNGPGRVPAHLAADGSLCSESTFPAYPQINMQLTREFRHFSLYLGGENLTNYRQPNPIVNAANPWADTFDPTLVWGPVHGIMLYAGIRLNLWKI